MRIKSNRFSIEKNFAGACLATVSLLISNTDLDGATVWLDSLDLNSMSQSWGEPKANHSVTDAPISINGRKFDRGVGTHANSSFTISVNGAEKFLASVGLDDDAARRGSVEFQIFADGKTIFDSGIMKSNAPAKPVDIDVHGIKRLVLKVTDAGDGIGFDHADWAEARFIVTGASPVPFVAEQEKAYLLTPKPGPAPRINGPTIYGARPGHPFLYRIPTQGTRPMVFSADGLPTGLDLDSNTGIISGTTPSRGEYSVTFHAKNNSGSDSRLFKLVCGDRLSLTPSMGFNDWYAYYDRVSDKLMRQAADILVSSGMADVGYQYVNIDDCWMNAAKNRDPQRNGPFRDAAGNLQPNVYFPDMKGLADYIHSLGLKAGLYTSPGPMTCGGFAGAFGHEEQDAKLFAEWGFDFLKYDWCSYGRIASGANKEEAIPHFGPGGANLEAYKFPYRKMGALLKQQNRDILFNLCQYGMGDVWKWGAEVGGQSWRTSGDLGGELNNIFGVALKNCDHRDWQKPGAWNDPDYIQIGYIGSANGSKPCPLSPNEQYAFMSLWCLMASPLFYSGDMNHLDDFTLNVLCNPEVIEVDQDPLGGCARVIKLDDERFLMIKVMADGSTSLGLGNRGESDASVPATWEQLGVSGHRRVRDLWRQKDLGVFSRRFETKVPRHAVVLVRLWPAKEK